MRIVIDMQGAQTESCFRGIGRYTIAFAQAVVRNRGQHEVFLVLSDLFPQTIEPIRAAFENLLPQENIRVWSSSGPISHRENKNIHSREVAEILREAFIASLYPDVIHISSLFEGYDDDAATSIGCFDIRTPVSVMLYDLIPMLNPDQYLKPNSNYSAYYKKKIEFLKKANVLLAISDSAKKEGLSCLGEDAGHIVNVSTSVDFKFKPIEIDEITKTTLFRKIGITRPFVFYVGGYDERKNLPRLIEAWSSLPIEIRNAHQLLFVGKGSDIKVANLLHVAYQNGLSEDEILFSGFISDEELIQLYNLCNLFVFPSWHEGFGLPVLEAMACGAAVIAANSTSLPEVIGLDEALFDPCDVNAICLKMQEVLTNQRLLIKLKNHGLHQSKKFSWDKTGQIAIATWEKLIEDRSISAHGYTKNSDGKNLIDTISSILGSADNEYLVDLSSRLALNECNGLEHQLLVDISELSQRDSATGVQRVVKNYLHHLLKNPPKGFKVLPVYATTSQGYKYANAYMAKNFDINDSILDDLPISWRRGDIFFGLDLQHHVQLSQATTYKKMRDEGVTVKFLVYDLLPIQLSELFQNQDLKQLHEKLMALIAQQDQAICISKVTADYYKAWIQDNEVKSNPNLLINWVSMGADLEVSQSSCDIPENAVDTLQLLKTRPTFLSVSTLEPRKAQTQILDAVEVLWAKHQDVNLVFVGQQGWKVEDLAERIINHPENGKRLFWLKGISDEYLEQVYKVSTCLVAASIDEGFGLPLIEAARHSLPVMARDISVFREVAGENAFYFNGESGEQLAIAMVKWLQLYQKMLAPKSENMRWYTWEQSTECLKNLLIEKIPTSRQLLVDISELVQRDACTGIQRVVRSVLGEWLTNPPLGFKVEPVYATVDKGYRYAKNFKSIFLDEKNSSLSDQLIEFSAGDFFLGLDLNHQIPRVHQSFLEKMHRHGVNIHFVVYDLLPIQFPQFCEQQHSVNLAVAEWMSVISSFDGAICISQSVAEDLALWIEKNPRTSQRDFKIDWFHLGADIESSQPTMGFNRDDLNTLAHLKTNPSFLMVGTLEPRKGHELVLDAFEKLWKADININLVLVGKRGWLVDSLVKRLRNHKELGKRLFWLEAISDECLEMAYSGSSCLIAASYGEGFGLPLIEAAQHKLPIICRDIPVFREVAGENAFYFNATNSEQLAESLKQWLDLYKKDQHPRSDSMPWLTWRQSASQLLSAIGINPP